ncbi:hypothetical protein BEWA_022930 [Theileria equi strain WA]|uniref:Uncharacterized protein n=1 Tax=Theileria equi strain WA TaxID=1537102 RepID=L0AV82_THEEQ|nr:hypothetical protein BEWA_022930 [Theileria equi strain WA]AFZ79445.1 hypothetical protein BEWA_022930 [Theileria equi strain WA]|eukprot:XP_004829111.1 hypothetical protein BEWA_022930 [Theileria equi strain WA]
MFNVEKRRMENVYSVSSSVKRARDSVDIEDETPTTSTSLDSLHAKFARNGESPKESRTEDTWEFSTNGSPLDKASEMPVKPPFKEVGNTAINSGIGNNADVSTPSLPLSIDTHALPGFSTKFPSGESQKLLDKTTPLVKDHSPSYIFPTSYNTPDYTSNDALNDTLEDFVNDEDVPAFERQRQAIDSSIAATEGTLGRNTQKISSKLTEKGYRDSLMEAYRNISREVSRDPLYPPLSILSKRRGRLEMPSKNSHRGIPSSAQEQPLDYASRDANSLRQYTPYPERPSMEHEEASAPTTRQNGSRINVNMNEISMESTSRSSVFRIPVTIQDEMSEAQAEFTDEVADANADKGTGTDADIDNVQEKEVRPTGGCGHDCLSLPMEDNMIEITSIYDLILDMRFCSLQLPIPNDFTGSREFILETNESSSITNYDICYDEDLGSNFVMAEPFRFFCKVHITFDKDGEYWCCCYYDASGNYVQKRFNTADIDFNTAQMLANRCRDAAEKTFHSIWILKHKSLLERPIPDGLAESFVHTVNSINECVNNEDCIVCCADKIQRILQDR